MSDFFILLFVALLFLVAPVMVLILLIRFLTKRSCKRIGIATLVCFVAIFWSLILSFITDPATWCEHEYAIIEEVAPTCTVDGKVVKKCSLCETEDTEIIEASHSWKTQEETPSTCTNGGYILTKCEVCSATQEDYTEALGHDMREISRTEPTGDNDGKIVYRCSRCRVESTETIANPNPKGSEGNPYVLDADTWYSSHISGTSQKKYLNQWVKITGTVINISDYGSLKGYYLAGGTGQGLVCWVDSSKLDAQYGQHIEYIGKVTVEDSKHIEIADGGRVLNATWPTEKKKSPVTISDWSWTRDYVGGVEWSFRLTNNTDKVIKYVTIAWDCYNAVGDLVYDEITGKSSHSVKYTGPLNPGETTGYLSNSTRFYSYSYKSSKFTLLQVEFMDGTIIRVNDKAYTDIVVSKLESETVYDD